MKMYAFFTLLFAILLGPTLIGLTMAHGIPPTQSSLIMVLTVTPTPTAPVTPTPTPVGSWLNEPRVALIGAVLSFIGALLSAAIAFYSAAMQRRGLREQLVQQQAQFEQEFEQQQEELAEQQRRFQEEMQLKWEQLERERPMPGKRALDELQILLPKQPLPRNEAIGTPYVVGPPVAAPADFYDRVGAVGTLYRRLQGKQMLSTSVLGLRRAGKTSFLLHVIHPEVKRAQLKGSADAYLLVYINLQQGIETPSDFYRCLMDEANATLARQQGKSPPPPLPRGETTLDDLAAYLDIVCRTGLRVAFLLDEFEDLTDGDAFKKDFLEGLRALVTGRELAWVTTSYRDLYQLGSKCGLPKGSPFFNIFYPEPIFMGGFSYEDARLLVVEPAAGKGIDFTEDEVAFVIRLSGRLPHALQMAASLLFRERQEDRSSVEARENVYRIFFQAMARHFEHYWEGLDRAQRDALGRLAKRAPQKLTAHIRDYGPDPLKRLLAYGLIEEIEGNYRIAGAAFADWIRTHE